MPYAMNAGMESGSVAPLVRNLALKWRYTNMK